VAVRISGGQLEHVVDELILTPNIGPAHPSNLSLPHRNRRFFAQPEAALTINTHEDRYTEGVVSPEFLRRNERARLDTAFEEIEKAERFLECVDEQTSGSDRAAPGVSESKETNCPT
jgi:hypothetical protein